MEDNILMCEYRGQYTDEELALLNMEITPEIEKILGDALLEKAMKDAVMYVPQYGNSVDVERELMNNIDLFEEYIRLSKEREQYQVQWEALRYARSAWWSLFKEEMEAPWLEYDKYVAMLDRRMLVVQPTNDQWNKAMSLKSLIFQRAMMKQQDRRGITYPIYLKAMDATRKCQAFWNTKAGHTLSVLNKERSAVWNAISTLNCTWEDYNNLINTEINPYWTNGDTEEVDSMELMCTSVYETLDMLEDASHEEDAQYSSPESRSIGYWSFRNQAIAMHIAKQRSLANDIEDAYQASLVAFTEEYLCGSSDSLSSVNGAYTC